MTRENLISAAGQAAASLGYTLYDGDNLMTAVKTSGFPIAWLMPLKVVGTEGYRDCRVTYSLTVKLLMLNDYKEESKHAVRQILERDAMDFARILAACDTVRNVTDFTAEPVSIPLTHAGDIALEAKMNVEMFYCV